MELFSFFLSVFAVLSVLCAAVYTYSKREQKSSSGTTQKKKKKKKANGGASSAAEDSTSSSARDGAKGADSGEQKLTSNSKKQRGAEGESKKERASFAQFQRVYLLIYFLVMFADWLQGPYVYALYVYEYQLSKGEVGMLFVAGFSSSMVVGTFIGGIADKFGRKKMAIAFAVLYSVGCLTKLVNDFWVLMVGRLLSGVATSLLFSVFEAWMVSEHNARNYPKARLGETFSIATFGNGLTAIAAGVVASFVAQSFGYVAPFMVSLGVLVLSGVLVFSMWNENYGNSKVEVLRGFVDAWRVTTSDSRVALLGSMQSLFEGSMYTFVFMWTPVMQQSAEAAGWITKDFPFGLVFACFMLCLMIGSAFFSIIVSSGAYSVEQLLGLVLLASGAALSTPFWSNSFPLLLVAFLVFEVCCGLYFPTIGTLRGKYIPEAQRSAVMNFFRVPLNLLVVLVLLNVDSLSTGTVFAVVTSWLLLGAALHRVWQARVKN